MEPVLSRWVGRRGWGEGGCALHSACGPCCRPLVERRVRSQVEVSSIT